MNKIEKLLQELCPKGVEYKELGDLGYFFGGLNGKTKEDFVNGNYRYVSYLNIYKNISVDLTQNDFVRIKEGEKQKSLQKGDILFTISSEILNDVAISSVVTQTTEEPICFVSPHY